jgi:histidine triad (HIT) family protein
VNAACPFCDYAGPSPVLAYLHGCLIFEPLTPVIKGHVVVVPKTHVVSVGKAKLWDGEQKDAVAGAFCAATFWSQQYDASNIITSSGRAATQSIEHLHVHVIPRREGDGLALPWSATA